MARSGPRRKDRFARAAESTARREREIQERIDSRRPAKGKESKQAMQAGARRYPAPILVISSHSEAQVHRAFKKRSLLMIFGGAAASLIGAARAALWHQLRHGGSMLEHARACVALVEPSLDSPPTA